jgi:hypothetical protein
VFLITSRYALIWFRYDLSSLLFLLGFRLPSALELSVYLSILINFFFIFIGPVFSGMYNSNVSGRLPALPGCDTFWFYFTYFLTFYYRSKIIRLCFITLIICSLPRFLFSLSSFLHPGLCLLAGTLSSPSPFFCFSHFSDRISHLCPGLALDCDLPTYYLPCSWIIGVHHHDWIHSLSLTNFFLWAVLEL